ncbi:hypothetical protein H0G86_012889 [Trichoderma simmonsii]|uniref:Uncharacterized protein n=1 Tax=Trichoderma simmonsii TaxID=1491479 RepID=A0A8G0PRC1_9HYPO|nr:hypothetical protein H0G86_012889 [Trichoderma simmonsii]
MPNMSWRFKNLDRRAQNAVHYHFLNHQETHLVPLVDLRTGNEIDGFPNSVIKSSEIDEATARNILDALEINHQGYNGDSVRELVRFHVYYA